MILFVIALIVAVIALLMLAVAALEKDGGLMAGGVGVLVVAIALYVLSSLAVVPTRNVGVPTEFGKPTGDTYGPGLHWKAPWIKVTDIDATVQTEEYKGEDCIYVRIADGTSACISMTYRWRIRPESADKIYQDYRNSDVEINDAVRKALVSTNVKASINEALADYNPLTLPNEIDSNSTPEELANIELDVVPDYDALNAEITALLNEKIEAVGDLIEVQQITVSYVKLSETTESKINQFVNAVQETRIALQRKATAAAEAAANEILADSLSNDPNVLVSKCLDLVADGASLPAGFQCWDGTGSAVVIPGGTK